jgi:hypothetical protein
VLAVPVVALALLLTELLTGHERSDFEELIPVDPGGSATVDLALGEGFSFDRGSLHVRSHDTNDVRVVAESSGWGRYAIDLDLSHESDRLALVGRVDGFLYWLFGGPTVNVSLWLPEEFTLEARISGGPLVLEDLAGPLAITASAEGGDVTLRRAEGTIRLASTSGSIDVEDVEGDLEVQARDGEIDVAGVRGAVTVLAEHGTVEVESVTGPVTVASRIGRLHGSVDIESVTGPVTVESEHGRVEIDRVRGKVSVTTGRAGIEVEDVDGSVVARTERGGIRLEEVDGEVRARSGRGSIEVVFRGAPRGEIETERGDIGVRVPDQVGFDLDARTERGDIQLDGVGPRRDPTEETEEHEAPGARSRGAEVIQAIHGGGPRLRLRTGRGTLRVE